jgi:hypothetical protein
MQHLWYALIALVAYATIAPLAEVAMQDLPADSAALVTNGMLATVTTASVTVFLMTFEG